MKNVTEVQHLIRERLRKIGFAETNHIRLYGEELLFVSNPVPKGNGFSIEAICHNSGSKKNVRIPLSLVHTLMREIGYQSQKAA